MEPTLQENIQGILDRSNLSEEDDTKMYSLAVNTDFSYPRVALISSTTEGFVTMLVAEDNEVLERVLKNLLADQETSSLEAVEDAFLMNVMETWKVSLW